MTLSNLQSPPVAPATQTLQEALNKYKRQVSILKKGYGQERFRIAVILRSFLGDMGVHEVTSVHIATYRDQRLESLNPKTHKPISPATVRLELSLLSNFFEIARIEWGLCGDNPVKLVRKPKPPPGRDRRLTAREDRQILRHAHNYSNRDLYSIIVLALESAMRQGEILNLRWEHIHLKSRIAHLPETKNGSKRDVPLSPKARDALIRMGVKSSGRVFSYSKEGLKSVWRAMTIKLGIEDLHFHDLRHEATSRFFELGTLDSVEIAAITGHKSMAMLKRYTHLKAQRLVRKLDSGRNKKRQVLLDIFIPYPGLLTQQEDGFAVQLLDFEDLYGYGQTKEQAIQNASNTLMRKLLTVSMRDGPENLPEPDQFLDEIDESRVVMIDPLNQTEDQNTQNFQESVKPESQEEAISEGGST